MPGSWPRPLRCVNGVNEVHEALMRADRTATATATTATRGIRGLSLSSTREAGLKRQSSSAVQWIPVQRRPSTSTSTKPVIGSQQLASSHPIAKFTVVRELSCWVSAQQQQQDTTTSQARKKASIDTSENLSKQEETGTGDLEGVSTTKTLSASETTSKDDAPPPRGPLSIVFTDIVKSTAIWEAHAAAMASAMQTHDNTIRTLITANSGYEVKQNGDGFMIAFRSASSAVQFCLDVQEQLLDENWPSAILKLAPGKETTDEKGHVLFRGLKLRMSAHWGEPVCNWNEVIQRMDYLGPMVNRAARFIEVTEGGQVVVSEDFLLRLQAELEEELDKGDDEDSSSANKSSGLRHHLPEELDLCLLRSDKEQKSLTHQPFRLRLLGSHEFKGLNEPQRLYFIVPTSLEGRVEHWHQVTHVSGVKGNVRTLKTAATTPTVND